MKIGVRHRSVRRSRERHQARCPDLAAPGRGGPPGTIAPASRHAVRSTVPAPRGVERGTSVHGAAPGATAIKTCAGQTPHSARPPLYRPIRAVSSNPWADAGRSRLQGIFGFSACWRERLRSRSWTPARRLACLRQLPARPRFSPPERSARCAMVEASPWRTGATSALPASRSPTRGLPAKPLRGPRPERRPGRHSKRSWRVKMWSCAKPPHGRPLRSYPRVRLRQSGRRCGLGRA